MGSNAANFTANESISFSTENLSVPRSAESQGLYLGSYKHKVEMLDERAIVDNACMVALTVTSLKFYFSCQNCNLVISFIGVIDLK